MNLAARFHETFTFPERVNEVAARFVAGFVVLSALTIVALRGPAFYFLPVLSLGFLLRVLAGPRLSPLALFVTKVLLPRLPLRVRLVAGAPKRFAQGIGFTVTAGASIAFFTGAQVVSIVLTCILLIAASLEAVLGICLGCWMYGRLVRLGLIKEPTCQSCIDYEI